MFQQIQTLVYFPEEGSGIKVKILEAMLMQCAVVTNSTGLEGMDASVTDHIVLASSIEEAVSQALSLVESPEGLQNRGLSGRQYVIEHHDPTQSFAKLQKIYQTMVKTKV